MAVYSMMTGGMAPLGALTAGAAAERIGAPRTVAIGGVACAIGRFGSGGTGPDCANRRASCWWLRE
jgi:hypothetical protein